MILPPGLMISAPASGTGKTTVMLGLCRALAEEGLTVQPFKSGPDYIDPAFHRAAAGRPSFNLDSWAMAPCLMAALAGQAKGADIAVAEGSMGLFDGVAGRGGSGHGSSAELARAMGWPVVLVLDVGGQAQSAAATALGFARYDPGLPFAGVILNRVASPRHERLIRLGMERAEIRVLGALPRRGDLKLPERHLGLVQAAEHPDLETAIAAYAAFLRAHVDLAALKMLAAGTATGAPSPLPCPPAQRIALAQDAAFSFTYPHLLAGWHAAGAEVLPFSPLADEPPPEADLVWLPGGYPELHAGRIAAAGRFMAGLRAHADTRPVHGECGGYMVLGQALTDASGTAHAMAGLLGLATSYEKRRLHLGYRLATLQAPMPGHAPGTRLRGHEFHYSTILSQPDAPLANVTDADGAPVAETGSRRGHVTGTFFHFIAEDAE
ncbi:hydrogenobyrinic acid a,c-diamide synthase (glutamine-hydrolysing) /cobyrinate a,c-diamide synthase [Gemmobacter caeni]|uniref:Hydrogenobyrinate a,c-diamide synthase n=1 Tax=Gemmobacter caeni TaxID=589035 RepID=A0A2T6AG45_9RHOB|nr:cobyrinate a,c-diamide synthase [Gemmobacter caeni]PTX42810.1 cobyrinic acid a,c-diamide synthase [Gemmobacter caeni]TWI92452.1 hydrogenobyrinic acid a,c-diamide synthase (glutamine-hydrolysing) /cobyrinate a,c-diamide synthase [Gemmobacter caeni]